MHQGYSGHLFQLDKGQLVKTICIEAKHVVKMESKHAARKQSYMYLVHMVDSYVQIQVSTTTHERLLSTIISKHATCTFLTYDWIVIFKSFNIQYFVFYFQCRFQPQETVCSICKTTTTNVFITSR